MPLLSSRPSVRPVAESMIPMRKLIEYVARSLVDHPEAVQVREVRNDRIALALELRVDQEDFGKVIGRQGRVAKAMRSLLRSAGAKQGKHTSLEIDERPSHPV